MRNISICAIGDSTVFGFGDRSAHGSWVQRVRYRAESEYRPPDARYFFHNYGIPGHDTAQILSRIGDAMVNRAPDVWIIGCSINDRMHADKPMPPNPSMAPLIELWRYTLDHMRKWYPAILILPALGVEESKMPIAGQQARFTWRNADIEKYNAQLGEFFTSVGAEYLTAAQIWPDGANGLTVDGLHPNDRGYDLIADAVYKKIKSMGWFDPAQLPKPNADWNEIPAFLDRLRSMSGQLYQTGNL